MLELDVQCKVSRTERSATRYGALGWVLCFGCLRVYLKFRRLYRLRFLFIELFKGLLLRDVESGWVGTWVPFTSAGCFDVDCTPCLSSGF